MAGYARDPVATKMLAKLSIHPHAIPGFSLRDGLSAMDRAFGLGQILNSNRSFFK
jgi:hypothetical protein